MKTNVLCVDRKTYHEFIECIAAVLNKDFGVVEEALFNELKKEDIDNVKLNNTGSKTFVIRDDNDEIVLLYSRVEFLYKYRDKIVDEVLMK